MSMMIPYLHFTGGDYLFFDVWQPKSPGALAGACVGLIVLALFERWLAATRVMFASYWEQRAAALTAARDQVVVNRKVANTDGLTDKHYLVKPDTYETGRRVSTSSPNPNSPNPNSRSNSRDRRTVAVNARKRTVAPFIAAHDIPRGILFALQMLVMYTLMLAVMTFQAAYIIVIVLGLGLGEVFFGRVASAAGH
ncbi:hypothetical protein HYPSUDRAFT_36796 [Hypholoma sublateritium FD-334 SS-4]|uniref:Copper transport protein n=1 Tax=Hypholoma sublateritium (strain FD-334 SS-4) TaxID=945553 RepID=A0A0D2LEK1_HYPSF|nr:hypothetical protein HYPSUDRAFT_36796 [Hypholoma sublateritium FD-334 SS-4]